MTFLDQDIEFGNRRIVGQKKAINQVERTFRSDRLSHAYLLSGPAGTGKTAFALAMAEIVNGIDHLTDLKGTARSKKSSWYKHPDIHLFLPLPSTVGSSEHQSRLELLAKDPYEIVDFSLRPALGNEDSTKNRRAFYSIDYYRDEIRPKTVLKPNEGKRTVIILTGIDTMRKESANAFLKLLEEPSDNVMFILTATKSDQLLPTIVSRCQHIRLAPLTQEEITNGLVTYDGMAKEDAQFMARVSGGNYALTRFLDLNTLQKTRKQSIDFLRHSYTQNAGELLDLIQDWNRNLNTEGQIALCNTLEQLLRDIMVYRETEKDHFITNIDQLDVIKKFCETLKDARLQEMIEHLQDLKMLLYQNVQFKLIFTSLSFRYSSLMRGLETEIKTSDSWQHLPAFTE